MIGFAVGMLFIGVVMYFWISFLTRDERMIEGIPDGWELVRVGMPAVGEYYIDVTGSIYKALDTTPTVLHWYVPVIRKIEKPKQYRPFASAAEFEPHRDRWVKRHDSLGSASRISGYGDKGVVIHGSVFTFEALFRDHTFDDGTPFGIEVTE